MIAGVLLIVLNIIIFTAIIRSINQPLSRMINMCEEMGKGNFSIRIPCSQTDELSYLMSSLNSMSERIEQLINEVYVKKSYQTGSGIADAPLTDQSAFSVLTPWKICECLPIHRDIPI